MSLDNIPVEDSIELSAKDARELARLLGLLLKTDLQSPVPNTLLNSTPAQSRQGRPEDRARIVATARAVFFERKRRSRHFSPVLFGEHGWDMLLALYITDFAGGRLSIGKLVSWIGAPQTTALRWIDYLEKERLISREPHPRDRRTVFVDITDKGRQKLNDYFSALAFPLSG